MIFFTSCVAFGLTVLCASQARGKAAAGVDACTETLARLLLVCFEHALLRLAGLMGAVMSTHRLEQSSGLCVGL